MIDRFNLDKKNVLVVGSLGLLGSEFVKILKEANANVIEADIKFNKDSFKRLDVTKETDVIQFVEKVIEKYKRIDVLVNTFALNPQIINEDNSFENYSLQKWNATINVNLTGTFLMCREVGRYMIKQPLNSAIVNVTSQLGLVAPDQTIYDNGYIKPSAYCAGSSGIFGLTRYLASYWRSKIRVNALVASMVFNYQDGNFIDTVRKKIPLGRMSLKSEFNEAMLFLCSDASSYMTGSDLVCDGGYSIW